MKIFAKRAWDFDPATWPVVSFSSKGDRDNLLRAAASGDQIILVGTQTKHTPRAKQGRLLGIAEIGEAVDTLSVVRVEESEENLFDGGQFRWPYAVLMAKPRRFEPQPLLRKELGDQLPIDPTVRAVQLSERDAAKVLSLPSVEILREKMLVGSSARRSPGQGDEAGGLRAKTGRIGSDSGRLPSLLWKADSTTSVTDPLCTGFKQLFRLTSGVCSFIEAAEDTLFRDGQSTDRASEKAVDSPARLDRPMSG